MLTQAFLAFSASCKLQDLTTLFPGKNSQNPVDGKVRGHKSRSRCGGKQKNSSPRRKPQPKRPAYSSGIILIELFSLLTTGTVTWTRNFMSVFQFGYGVSVSHFEADFILECSDLYSFTVKRMST
jgi:hypothetical protein